MGSDIETFCNCKEQLKDIFNPELENVTLIMYFNLIYISFIYRISVVIKLSKQRKTKIKM